MSESKRDASPVVKNIFGKHVLRKLRNGELLPTSSLRTQYIKIYVCKIIDFIYVMLYIYIYIYIHPIAIAIRVGGIYLFPIGTNLESSSQ